jgi:hypothetical protein
LQQAAAAAVVVAAEAHTLAAKELRRAAAAVELCKRARVRTLAPSDGWQTEPAAVTRRVVENEQENVVTDEEVVLEEDLSDEAHWIK